MFRSFFASKKYFWIAYGTGTLLVVLTLFNVWLNIHIGQTIGELSKMLEHSGKHRFIEYTELLGEFLACLVGFVLTDMPTQYFAKMFALDWRRAITDNLIPRWEKIVGKTELKGMSQRLQEEPYNFSKFFDSMGLQLLHAFCVIWGFSYELAKVGPVVLHPQWTVDIDIGALPFVAFAMLMSGIFGTLFFRRKFRYRFLLTVLVAGYVFFGVGPTVLTFSWVVDMKIGWFPIISFVLFVVGLVGAVFIGWKFPRMENHNRDAEAKYRKDLELVEYGKEPYNKETLTTVFLLVYQSYKRYFQWVVPLDGWKSLYWNSITIIPYIIGGYWIFPHTITYAHLAPILYNFGQYMGALSLFLNNWRQMVDFLATWRRLRALEDEIDGKGIEMAVEAIKPSPPVIVGKKSPTLVYDGKTVSITKEELAFFIKHLRENRF